MPKSHQPATTDGPAEGRSPLAGWLIVIGVVVLTPIVLLVIGAAILAWQWRQLNATAAAAVQEELARIRADGQPIATRDMYAFHRPPPGTADTTQHWLAVLGSLPEEQFNQDASALPIVGQGDIGLITMKDAKALADAEALLSKYQSTLELAHEAARQPGQCHYPVKFEQGMTALLPHAQQVRGVQRLLSLDVHVQAARGDAEGAVKSLETMYAASESMANQLSLVEHLVRVATATMALRDTMHVLNTTTLSDEQLARLQKRVEACDLQAGLTHSLIGERGIGYRALQQMGSAAGAAAPVQPNDSGAVSRPADLEKYLLTLAELIDASKEPYPGALRLAQTVEAKTKALAATGNPLQRMKYQLTVMITPASTAAFEATGRGLAQRDLVRTAIAARRYELQTGALPAAAADLVPQYLSAVPVDPFDGTNIRFVSGAEDLVVYSVGKDGRDDGGTESEDSGQPDIVVRLSVGPEPVVP